jgi:hypothetical protein
VNGRRKVIVVSVVRTGVVLLPLPS